jgi:hypothetical protein
MSRVLPSTGPLSATDINNAMSIPPGNKESTDPISLNDSGTGVSVRMMFNKSSGAISFEDGRGKAYCTIYALDQPDCYIYDTGDDPGYSFSLCPGGFGSTNNAGGTGELNDYCVQEGSVSPDPMISGTRCGSAKFDVVFCDGTVVNGRIVSSLENDLCFRANPTAIAADNDLYGLGTWSGGTSTQCYSEGT